MRGNTFDFSFSGLKTAVLYHVRENPDYLPEIAVRCKRLIARGEGKFEATVTTVCAEDSRSGQGIPERRGARFARADHSSRGRVRRADRAGFWWCSGEPAVACDLRGERAQRRASCVFSQSRLIDRQCGNDCSCGLSAPAKSYFGGCFTECLGGAANRLEIAPLSQLTLILSK